MIFFLSLLSITIGKQELEDLNHIVSYTKIFELPTKNLCWAHKGSYYYNPKVDKFMEEFKASYLYDRNHLKTLRPYYPKPLDKISQMKYSELKAVLTMIIEGESVREGCFCNCIERGQVIEIMRHLTSIAAATAGRPDL